MPLCPECTYDGKSLERQLAGLRRENKRLKDRYDRALRDARLEARREYWRKNKAEQRALQ